MITPMLNMRTGKLHFLVPLAAAVFLVMASASAQAAPDQSRVIRISAANSEPQHLILPLDKAAIVELDTNASDVLVSNPQVVDAVVRSPRRIFVLALKVGQTNAFFFDGSGHQIASLDIRVERDVAVLDDTIVRHMPNSSVKVEALNDNIVLDGTVTSASDASAAQDLASRFVGDPNKVVNMLKVDQHQQVMIKVRVAEMNRNVAKQLGVDLSSITSPGHVPLLVSTSNPFGLLGRALADASGLTTGELK